MKKIIDTIIIQESVDNAMNFPGLNIPGIESIYDIEVIMITNGKEEKREKLNILDHSNMQHFDGVLNISKILWDIFSDLILQDIDNPPVISIALVQCEYKFQKHIKEIYATIHPVFKVNEIRIFAGESISDITIDGNSITDNLNIKTHGKINELYIKGVQNLKISGIGNISNEINLSDLKEGQVIDISSLVTNKLSIVNLDTNIPKYKNLKKLRLSNMKINEINFQGWSFSQIKVIDVNISGTRILGGFIGYIDIEEFHLSNSYLDNIHLSEIKFPENQKKFTILDSVIQKNIFSNISWSNFLSEFDGKNKISNGGLKETYRMIKHQYDEIGNKTEANKFFAKEMEYHIKSLEESGNKKDYWIALAQKKISNFGQDWRRALFVYLVLIFIGFTCYESFQITKPELVFDFSWNGFIKGMEDFTDLANPLPKVEEINNIYSLLFSIIKILIVYQIVVALRRISQR
ncbi:hypothetical protein K2X92_04620 [Candidatus Gracilibacteria bacterium]|nr:hypothetical protein [Candidatus Gracilibacteria bacterium]